MRNFFAYVLSICSFLFVVTFLGFIINCIKNKIRKKKGLPPVERAKVFNGSHEPVDIGFRIALILGATYLVILLFFTNTTIGSVFEKSNYKEEYYVLKYPSYESNDCTKMKAVISKSDGEYYLIGVYYGAVVQKDVDTLYSLEVGYKVEAEINGKECYIELLPLKVPD